MTTEHTSQFLDELNQYHDEPDRTRCAAMVFVLYKKHGSGPSANWCKAWQSNHESLELGLVATRDDLEITLRLLPHLDIEKNATEFRAFGRSMSVFETAGSHREF